MTPDLNDIRRWLRRRQARYGQRVASSRRPDPIHTRQLAEQVRGQWVAMKNGVVVEVGETFDQLMLQLHTRDISDVTVMRVPGEHESELVGLG